MALPAGLVALVVLVLTFSGPGAAIAAPLEAETRFVCSSDELGVEVPATLRIAGTLPTRVAVGEQVGITDGEVQLTLASAGVDGLRARGYRAASATFFSLRFGFSRATPNVLNLASTSLGTSTGALAADAATTVAAALPARTVTAGGPAGTPISALLESAGATWTLTRKDGSTVGADLSWGCGIGGTPLALRVIEVVDPTPYVLRVAPSTVSHVWGGLVRIDGARLGGARAVRVAGIAVPFLLVDSRRLVAYLPPLPAGQRPVTVTSSGGTSEAVPVTFR